MAMTRRIFVKQGAVALAGSAAVPGFLTRAVIAAGTKATKGKRLVVIFQRGAVDGLNVVVPTMEPNYYAMRPGIAIAQEKVLALDGGFGLHPAMGAMQELYKAGQLAVVHAVGSPDGTRSHFDAQDFMESGTPGLKSTADGWLNRALVAEDAMLAAKKRAVARTAFRAVALGPEIPRTLLGRVPALAIANLQDFAVGGRGPNAAPVSQAFEAMYGESGDKLLHATGDSTFEAIRMLRATEPGKYVPAAGVVYPNNGLARNLMQVAQLLKGDLGLEVAFTDMGGWDTHQNQGNVQGQLADRLREFSEAIGVFWRDLGDEAENVTLVTMSEFGRTARQNGTGGTDHGHGNVMFVLGGQVKGGKVYGKWPGLADEQLNEGRDLVVTTDYRAVVGEVVSRTLGGDLRGVFPGWPGGGLGLMKG